MNPTGVALIVLFAFSPFVAASDDFERAPIRYSSATPANAISRLQAQLDSGAIQLSFHKDLGYLPAVLKALNVPTASQTLVFSKTSLQRSRIAPKSPRAIYFSDDMYVGYCQAGQVLEISAVDPKLGAVFYTLEQQETDRPKFQRQIEGCILCHGSSQTKHVPGHILRSVYADRWGEAILSLGSTRVDQATAFDRRWGGWYVTGTHGKQTHLGNLIVRSRSDRETIANNPEGQNITDLKAFFDPSAYLTPHSDLVALMVLEHQAEAHNLIARATIQTRLALHDQALLNKELGRPADEVSETTQRRIKSIGEPLMRYLLFGGEAKLTAKVQGTSTFASDFAKAGPRDRKGRSLREFDLSRRLFKYPCSYLIFSEAFDAMPTAMKEYVYQRMHEVLIDRDYTGGFGHLSPDDRQAILEILRDTKKDLPSYWREATSARSVP
ncbi:MAG: hypothetical protein HYR84_00470 [Planctomycetes bacterium]|nr:hypothetical protein [Planctomycetota bacterium]